MFKITEGDCVVMLMPDNVQSGSIIIVDTAAADYGLIRMEIFSRRISSQWKAFHCMQKLFTSNQTIRFHF